jgi:hypothetical protein
MIEIDRKRFLELREEIGTLPAREQCMREGVLLAIEEAGTVDDLKCVLLEIVKNIKFRQ